MTTINLQINNKFKFNRALKILKSSTLWGVQLKYNPVKKTWSFGYDKNDKEQVGRLTEVLSYGWDQIQNQKDNGWCPKCQSHCFGDCDQLRIKNDNEIKIQKKCNKNK